MSQVQHLEEQLIDGDERIKRGNAVQRLIRNPDFKEVIVDYFSTVDCARYARESVDPALTEEQRASALAFAQAAGYLKQWLTYQIRFGETAQAQRQELVDAIEEARAEDVGAA